MKVLIRIIGSSFEINAEPTDTIQAVKSNIQGLRGFAVDLQKIICLGEVLEDDRTLESCGFSEDAKGKFLVLMVNQQNRPPTVPLTALATPTPSLSNFDVDTTLRPSALTPSAGPDQRPTPFVDPTNTAVSSAKPGPSSYPSALTSSVGLDQRPKSFVNPANTVISSAKSGSSATAIKLDIKRVQLRWNDLQGAYVAREDKPTKPEVSKDNQDPFVISVVRRFVGEKTQNVIEEIHVHSPFITAFVKSVMKSHRGINWEAHPLKFNPNTLLGYMPSFRDSLHKVADEYQETEIHHRRFFIEFIEAEYHALLEEFEGLKSTGQITWELVPSLLLSGELLFTHCPVTEDPVVVRLVGLDTVEGSMLLRLNTDEAPIFTPRHFSLTVEYVNVQSCRPGLSQTTIRIPQFTGVQRIRDLAAYPFELHKDHEEQKASLITRGKWHWELVREKYRHMRYNGMAYRHKKYRYRKVFVKSRFMIDQEMYDAYHPEYTTPRHTFDLDGDRFNGASRMTLTDDDYLLFSARVYGYSLPDREWLEFRVALVEKIQWKPNIFDTLEMESETKYTVRALVQTQCSEENDFDDFVLGKGKGLIFNLHGPPGLGKTLTAEATSEVTQSPLYMTGAGDLGTEASSLDNTLTKVFFLADRWRAVVLIDEADVFLEKRGSGDIKRNAMAAVFLRQLEYYRGILFLTTNRVEVFDEATMSRIHVTLYYDRLSPHARERLWTALLANTKTPQQLTTEQLKDLRELQLNGREIKNIVKVASTLASYEKRAIVFEDISKSLRVLNQPQKARSQQRTNGL